MRKEIKKDKTTLPFIYVLLSWQSDTTMIKLKVNKNHVPTELWMYWISGAFEEILKLFDLKYS